MSDAMEQTRRRIEDIRRKRLVADNESLRERAERAESVAETLIHSIEIDHDYGCECSACRAISAYRKVAPEATILQEKDTHFPCKEDV